MRLYISHRCAHSRALLEAINPADSGIEVVDVNATPDRPDYVTHVPTLVTDTDVHVGARILRWMREQRDDELPPEDPSEMGVPDPFASNGDEQPGDPFAGFGDIRPTISKDMEARINMSVNEAYDAMSSSRA